MNVVLRKARKSDFPAIRKLNKYILGGWEYEVKHIDGKWCRCYVLDDKDNDNDNIVGAAIFKIQETNVDIVTLAIKLDYRKMGLGKLLVNRIKNVAIRNQCKFITLGTMKRFKVTTFYKKLGFKIYSDEDDYWEMQNDLAWNS